MMNYRDYEKECDNMKVSECEELITLYRGLQEKFDNDVFMVMTSIYKIGFVRGMNNSDKHLDIINKISVIQNDVSKLMFISNELFEFFNENSKIFNENKNLILHERERLRPLAHMLFDYVIEVGNYISEIQKITGEI